MVAQKPQELEKRKHLRSEPSALFFFFLRFSFSHSFASLSPSLSLSSEEEGVSGPL